MSNTLNFVLASPNDAADKIDEMEKRVEALEGALWGIASQRLTEDISQDDLDEANFEGAYDRLIGIARAALAPEQDK